MRRTFPGCCANATAPPKANVKVKAKIPHHFGFWIADFRLSDRNQRNGRDLLVMSLAPDLKSQIENYLMTLSARYSIDCGIVMPICFAVLRLITSSNFVGCSTGKSAGLAPLRILSTK